MPKWFKTVLAVLLLPACLGAALALARVVRATGRADTIWFATMAGAACWLAIYWCLPRPMWLYVVGHELTHALWTWLFGGKVRRFQATARGGHVVVTKTNFLISLAPYFFPFYAFALIVLFLIGHLIWDWSRHLAWFHLLAGAAYAFHLTLTVHALKTRQSDVTQHGWLFSAVIILLGNVLVLLLGLPLLTREVRWLTALGWWFHGTGEVLLWLGRLW
jgi:hypothetical protein